VKRLQPSNASLIRVRKRRHRSLRLIALLLALLFQACTVGAADTRLTLGARVTDENGLPVAAAQVTLAVSGGLTLSAVTDDAGYFSIPNLSPGEYAVRIEKRDYFLLAEQKIDLRPDSGEFSFTLNHVQEVHETVDVTAPENTIDPTTTQSTASLTNKEIIDIPVASSHDLLQSLVAMPQVLRDASDQLHIAGANNTEVQYLLDGVEIGDPASNGLTSRAFRRRVCPSWRRDIELRHPRG